MKQHLWLCRMLIVLMLVALVACGGDTSLKVTVDENGLATWQPVKGAVAYEYSFVFDDGSGPTAYGSGQTTDTSVPIPEGYWLEIRPVLGGGEYGHWVQTEIFGDIANRVDLELPEDEPVLPPVDDPGHTPDDEGTQPPIDGELPQAVIHVSADGTATWDAVEGATYYHYVILYENEYGEYMGVYAEDVTEPATVFLQDGYLLSVETFFGDGPYSSARTEVYGDPSKRTTLMFGQIFSKHSVRWENLKAYELISHIDVDSVCVAEDGTVTFNAEGPLGETMRFYGRGVRVEEGRILLMPGSFLTALDAIGRIMTYETVTDKISVEGVSDDQAYIHMIGGYTFTDETHVNSYEDLTYTMGDSDYTAGHLTAYVDDGKTGPSMGKRAAGCAGLPAQFHRALRQLVFRGECKPL